MTKAELRIDYLKKRNELSDAEFNECNLLLLQALKTVDWSKFKIIHCFWPIIEKKEINTISFIQWLKEQYPEVMIVLPKSDFGKSLMSHIVFEGQDKLEKNKFGIWEPNSNDLVQANEIDLVLVPLLVADMQGNRVGYGKGFYDRFLSECRKDCRFVGLSLFEPIPEIEDLNEFDVQIHECLTPYQRYVFEHWS